MVCHIYLSVSTLAYLPYLSVRTSRWAARRKPAARRLGAMASYSAVSSGRPPPRVQRRDVPPSPHQVLGHVAEHAAVEQQLHFVLSFLSNVRYAVTGPGGGGSSSRAKKGLRRSTLTVGMQRILRGKASV